MYLYRAVKGNWRILRNFVLKYGDFSLIFKGVSNVVSSAGGEW